MAQNWTSRITDTAGTLGRVVRPLGRRFGRFENDDPDARRRRIELDAIRARFPDHA